MLSYHIYITRNLPPIISQVIVYPTRDNLQCMGAALILAGIWVLALLLASPMILFKRLAHFNVNLHAYNIHDVVFCVEDWPIKHGRAYYSVFSLVIQYLVPILIVSAAYTSIYGKLRSRIQIGGGCGGPSTDETVRERKLQRSRRMRRTNCMLVSIAVIFGVSWLPLNLYNLFSDIFMTDVSNTQSILVTYAVCHMMGMSSACSNPFMYGWLNDNFRKEFREILCMDTSAVCVVTEQTNANGDRSMAGSRSARRLLKCDGRGNSSAVGVDGDAAVGGASTSSPANERAKFAGDATEMTVLVR